MVASLSSPSLCNKWERLDDRGGIGGSSELLSRTERSVARLLPKDGLTSGVEG